MWDFHFPPSRTGNGTRGALERAVAALEGRRRRLAFVSGISATTTVVLSSLRGGDHITALEDLHGGTRRLFDRIMRNFGIQGRREFGDVESLIERSSSMTQASVPEEEQERIGITELLVRLSVEIENAEDLISDLSEAIDPV